MYNKIKELKELMYEYPEVLEDEWLDYWLELLNDMDDESCDKLLNILIRHKNKMTAFMRTLNLKNETMNPKDNFIHLDMNALKEAEAHRKRLTLLENIFLAIVVIALWISLSISTPILWFFYWLWVVWIFVTNFTIE